MHKKLRSNISAAFSNAGIFRNLPVIFTILFFSLIIFGCGGSGSGTNDGNTNAGSSDIQGADPPVTKSVTLAWNRPAANSDGSTLTDLAGYKVYYGPSTDNYTNSINVGNYTSVVISNLSSGVWCFAVSAYDHAGNESEFSSAACASL